MPAGSSDRVDLENARALSLWRPWGMLVFSDRLVEPKTPENRGSFRARWRGTLYVHSAQRWDATGESVAREMGLPVARGDVPTGYIGLVTLADVHAAEDEACRCSALWAAPGGVHLVLENPRPFKRAVDLPGRQSLFLPDPRVVAMTPDLLAR